MTTVSTEKWVLGSQNWASVFGTELNSLVAGKTVRSSVDIVNGTNLDMFMDVDFLLGSVTTTGSPYLGLYLLPLLSDGTTYGDGAWAAAATGIPPQQYYCGFGGVPVGTQVLTGDFQFPGRRSPLILPPGTSRLALYNGTNVNLAASANTIHVRSYNRQIVT